MKFHTIGEINTGNKCKVHAQFRYDLHSFDQNILSFENSLLETVRKDLIGSLIFRYFYFTLHLFHFICRKVSLRN